jgi:hypothetical protein
MKLSEIEVEVCIALDRIRHEVLKPRERGLITPGAQGRLAPSDRLVARLLILKAIKEWELVFVREIIEDREAIAAAKAEAKEVTP